ncbi:LysM peptidoglycan-binding domain-containing protein [Methylotenera sp. L2L1]|uniref:LysM peptidoglycan-binding domain-containing protein n=1 Tax=Methylotenera sp. L2L1 TaxID=1502770 RepID=UPI0005631EC2|nr:LysM peptidoglycan-binding domain-containing protein [Methylotenera sp. L2L1]
MGTQFFLRIGQSIKTSDALSRTLHPKLFISVFAAAIMFSAALHAEQNTISNVAGDEIIIFADDTFKPVVRDLGSKPEVSKELQSQKNTRGGRLADNLEITIKDNKVNSADETSTTLFDQQATQHDDLWQRIKNGYAMPDSTSALTNKHEDWYSSRPDYVQRMVERSQRYLFHIVEEVEKRGMPTEVALLPMIESAYNPKAYSKSSASGIWQFIPSTGKHFGLKQNWWVDNRRNITMATDAALTYLQKLHAMFGAWDLALAAYNAGEGTIGRAIERNRKLGLPTDYESLTLPDETRNYVPKLQAVKNLMTHPSNYGLKIPTIANTPYFAKVTAPARIDTHLVAKLAEINHEEFLALNPSYDRPLINSEHESLELLLPIMAAQTFRTNLANYEKPLVNWQTYQAKRGERMDTIASKFGINLAQLRDVNDLSSQAKMKKSTTLLVPKADDNENTPLTVIEDNSVDIEPSSKQTVTHKVKKGEVMQSIAKYYGVSVKQILAANSLRNSKVKAGQVLSIEVADAKNSDNTKKSASKSNASDKKKTYIVRRGDTLHSIAEKFDVAVADLKRWNKKSSSHIKPGAKLIIQ